MLSSRANYDTAQRQRRLDADADGNPRDGKENLIYLATQRNNVRAIKMLLKARAPKGEEL